MKSEDCQGPSSTGFTPDSSGLSGSMKNGTAATNSARAPKKQKFCCGVVEGFYGRPWTTEQRKDLFQKMQKWGMNSYIYAPKDDCKHRAYWRELYTVEEAEHLQSLIELAAECNIDFYYAISPGLDVVYSSAKEVGTLKRKLEQVSQLGCRSFALLFDDIEPEMCKQDKEVFQSFAQAQVTITNDVFEHLGRPNFMFCPTQYCTARAVPSIRASEYLTTLGAKLAPEINIMWTGDKVISKVISFKCLEDINEVLQRDVVIWDNEHANDYDQKRVFLGPYSGRSPEIIQKLNGVMTNPNCEYGANFVGIHTLAQWAKCTIDGTQPHSSANEAISADIKLEIQDGEGGDIDPAPVPDNVYHPRNALINAIKEWMPEFDKQKTVWAPMSKPQVGLTAPTLIPTVNTCMSTTGTTSLVNALTQPQMSSAETGNPAEINGNPGNSTPQTLDVSSVPAPVLAAAAVMADATPAPSSSNSSLNSGSMLPPSANIVSSSLQPISVPVMNSLVSTNKVVVDHTLLGGESLSGASTPSSTQMMGPPIGVATKADSNAVDAAAAAASSSAEEDSPMTPTSLPPVTPTAIAVANTVPVPPNIIPGPTYMEPMEEDGGTAQSNAMECSKDVPMESVTNPSTPASSTMHVETDSSLHKAESTTMLCEDSPPGGTMSVGHQVPVLEDNVTHNPEVTTMLCDEVCTNIKDVPNPKLTRKDLLLLCHLFYLPCDHGAIGIDLLNDFFWLKRNANTMLPPGTLGAGTTEDRQEWEQRANKFKQNVQDIQTLFAKLCSVQNRELVYDLYMYLWDMCGVVQTLEGFVQWLSKGSCSPKSQNYVVGQQTWFSGIREAFLSGEHEPWMFRGGLVSDLQRLLPLDSGNDLYLYKFPDVPASLLYYVRPFQPKDEEAIYSLAANWYEESIEAPMGLCAADRELVGDKLVGAYLTLCPEYTFVAESSLTGQIVAYSLAAPDAKTFYTRYSMAWLPEMRIKYPLKKTNSDEDILSPIEIMARSFHGPGAEPVFPQCLADANPDPGQQPWGVAQVRLCPNVSDASMSKRLTMLMLACLRASGTIRMFVEVKVGDLKMREFFSNLGYHMVNIPSGENPDELMVMSRSF
ncbi:hypothetical protein TCAL_10265 [Tigriopus californicus]|uniref:protein O-GlcNAcase n=1 Tax=Tigriopus californicus TaxID=6832 RepID=A0A553PQ67_TIGCA|nr:protein O-GlcNAcase-like isoform X1 [Tigriopus californicus]TRY79824.1 hypothetical protein TCAL_10265 [Tigriopus californicus]